MPQMAPLSWLVLFLFFILSFMIFNIKNFFMFNYNPKSSSSFKNNLHYNWKW